LRRCAPAAGAPRPAFDGAGVPAYAVAALGAGVRRGEAERPLSESDTTKSESDTANIDRGLQAAVAEHRAGRLAEAERGYRGVLAAAPEQPDALHLLGLLTQQRGEPAAAEALIRRAIAARPEAAAYHGSLGATLAALGRHAEAVAAFRRAVELAPRAAQAHYNLGCALQAAGQLDDAVAAYREALALQPGAVQAQMNLGTALRALGRRDEAIAAFKQAVELAPKQADAHYNLGHTLQTAERLEEAVAAYRRAIALQPGFAEAHSNLGNALRDLERLEEAVESYRRAIALRPRAAQARANLGVALNELGRYREAIDALQQAIGSGTATATTHYNLGRALHEAGRLDEAAAAYRQALALRADFANAAGNLVRLALAQGAPEHALAVCDDFLARDPGNALLLAYKAATLTELGRHDAARRLLAIERFVRPRIIETPPGYADLAAFNAALAAHVLSHPTLIYAPARHATRFGRHTGELLDEAKGPIAGLEAAIRAAVGDYLAAMAAEEGHPFPPARPRRWRLTAWAVVMDSQGHQVPHIHPSGWLSGVYYVQLPKVIAAERNDRAGWIEFGRPGEEVPVRREPEVSLLRPEPGKMVLFPSYLYHRTIPFEAAENRISIAFDVLPMEA